MKEPRGEGAGIGADWPLAVFTALAAGGGGLILAPLTAAATGTSEAAAARLQVPGALLLAAGLAVSLAHLGRPLRAPLAGRNLRRSRLSAEILLAVCTAGAAGVAGALRAPALPLAASALSAAFLVSLGLVYALPGQHAWRGAVRFTPLSMALLLSALAPAALIGAGAGSWRAAVAAIALADAALFVLRARRLASVPGWCRPAHPSLFRRRPALLGARLLLADLLPLALALAGRPHPAAALLGLGILADRFGFYALGCGPATEAEIKGVEELIADESARRARPAAS